MIRLETQAESIEAYQGIERSGKELCPCRTHLAVAFGGRSRQRRQIVPQHLERLVNDSVGGFERIRPAYPMTLRI